MRSAVVWFRRDLRLHDHPALSVAVREYDRVVPVFVLDRALIHGRYASAPRTEFMLDCLRALDRRLRERGSGLVVRAGDPESELPALAAEVGADAVLWSGDVSPYARRRDGRVTEALRGGGVTAQAQAGNYVVDVAELRTGSGGAYSVFTPFFRAWQEAPRRAVEAAPERLAPLPEALTSTAPPCAAGELGLAGPKLLDTAPLAPGEAAARAAARRWLDGGIGDYDHTADAPGAEGSSVLSPYLRWGCLSALELEQRARSLGGTGAAAWIRQLCWRDFYAHVLLHWPQNAELEFQPRLRGLEWEDPASHLDAWQRGETGYPLVDAGMRQLAQTGWMHNRVRLVVGSFLTKDLHLDWREGERWFARLLLDGEPAQNNGNWQWIASVGTDPAPAFRRMYNPTLQARRFDAHGRYMRRWLPELEHVPDELLSEPWHMSHAQQRAAGCRVGYDYPEPIIDHAAERRRALERYKTATEAR